jgi:homoserine kinase type II
MSDSEFPLAALQASFGVGEWRHVEALPAGKSQHYIVTTTTGRFVLRRSYRSKTADGVRFEHELVAHLRANGFPAPEFVPTVGGEPCAVVDGRLWRMARFVAGRPASVDAPGQVETVAGTLARYHRLVEGFTAGVPTPEAPFVPVALRERLAAVHAENRSRPVLPDDLAGRLPAALAEAELVCSRLEDLYATLPITTIHAGCRRSSVLFDDDGLAAVLDFDSAHHEARALDLAVAVHDFGKIYGDPGSPDYKVHLDPAVTARFARAYRSVSPLAPGELEAVPLLLTAKRLKRALGRYARLLAGEVLSENDRRKIVLELARVQSLRRGEELIPVMGGTGG